MGKFDGVLLISDFDNTLVYTEAALRSGLPSSLVLRRRALSFLLCLRPVMPFPHQSSSVQPRFSSRRKSLRNRSGELSCRRYRSQLFLRTP